LPRKKLLVSLHFAVELRPGWRWHNGGKMGCCGGKMGYWFRHVKAEQQAEA
jgi:hypothetical protein